MPAVNPDTGQIMHVSVEAWIFARTTLERLDRELDRMTRDRNYWYLRANYTEEEIREMYERASKGQDENGNWLWPDGERTRAA